MLCHLQQQVWVIHVELLSLRCAAIHLTQKLLSAHQLVHPHGGRAFLGQLLLVL